MKTIRRANDISIVKGKYYGNGRTDGEGFEYNLIHVIDVDRDQDVAINNATDKAWSPVITYEHRGEIKTCSEIKFKQIIEVDAYKDVTSTIEMHKKAESNKLTNPNYLAASKLINHTIASENGRYIATVEEVNLNSYTADVQVKIKVLGLDVESSFYKTYPLVNFGLDKIFTPTELAKLDATYGTASEETLLAIAVANKMDAEAEISFWHDVATRGKELGMSQELINHARVWVPSSNDVVKFVPAVSNEIKDVKNFVELVDGLSKNGEPYNVITGDKGNINIMDEKQTVEKIGKMRDIISEVPYKNKPIARRFDFEEDMKQLKEDLIELGHIDDKTNQYIDSPKEVKIEKQSLFEVVGVWKQKDEKFTIIGTDINGGLFAKIQFVKPGMQVYSIKRISSIDVM